MTVKKKLVQYLHPSSLHGLEHVGHPHLLPLVRLDAVAQSVVGIFKLFFFHLIWQVLGIA